MEPLKKFLLKFLKEILKHSLKEFLEESLESSRRNPSMVSRKKHAEIPRGTQYKISKISLKISEVTTEGGSGGIHEEALKKSLLSD